MTKNILAISGSDIYSGGGMQADLATFSQHGLYGMVALTSIVTAVADRFTVQPIAPDLFEKQLKSLERVDFAAIKIGLLPNKEIALAALNFLKNQSVPLIFDPVLIFKENKDYLVSEMCELFIDRFFPLATLITPNLREAELLAGISIKDLSGMIAAAEKLHQLGALNVVIKGGNRFNQAQATDLLYSSNGGFKEFSKPVLAANNNGAGCTFASSIASHIVRGETIEQAVEAAKDFVYQAILNSNEYGVFQSMPRPLGVLN